MTTKGDRRRWRLAAVVGAAVATAAWAQYPEEEDTDPEYGMDLVQLSYDRDWRTLWAGADRGVRFAMGSLNVRQWYLEPEVKFGADFTRWLRFDYYYYQREGLEPLRDERNRNDFGFEVRAWRGLWGGLSVSPAFWKREADAAFSVRWREDPTRWLRFRFSALDFDNNYSFERSKVDEGYEEIYAVPPRRYELAGAWVFPFGAEVAANAAWRQPSNKRYTYYYGQEPDRRRRFEERWARVEARQKVSPEVEVFYDGGWDAAEETVRYPSGAAAPGRTQAYDFRSGGALHLGGVYYEPPGRHRWRAGAGRRLQTRDGRFPNAAAENYDYAKLEWLYFGLWRARLWRELYLETGFMGERADTEYANGGGSPGKARRFDNRIPVSLEYKFTPRYAFKMASGVDLDARDWAAYLFYDKAYVYAVACF